jgi:hypothetical protein
MMSKKTIALLLLITVLGISVVIALIFFLRTRSIDEGSLPGASRPSPTSSVPEAQQDALRAELEMLASLPIDSDGDGLSDEEEMSLGTDPHDGDTDQDGYNDFVEVRTLNTNPSQPDPEGLEREVRPSDAPESSISSPEPSPPSPPPVSTDPDNDGLTTIQEEQIGTDPNNPDTDGDGFNDGDEVQAGYNPLGPGRLQ